MVRRMVIGKGRLLRGAILAGLGLLFTAGCGRSAERSLRAGFRDLEQGRDMRAMTRFEQALARGPDDLESALAWNGIGIAAARTGEADRAIEAFEASQRLHPDGGVSAYNLGVMRARAGDTAEATALLARAALLLPQDAVPLERLAHLLLERGMTDAALDRLRQALERKPRSPALHTAIGVAEWRARGPRAGLHAFMQALEHDAAYPPALYNLFLLWDQEMHRPKEALAYGRRFLAAAASPARLAAVRLRVEAIEAELAVALDGAVATAVEVPPAAHVRPAHVRLMEEARAKAGQGVSTAEAALRAAAEARRAGDRAAQEEALRFALDQAFDQSWVHAAWGTFERERGRTSEAERSYRRALALDARDAGAHFGLGMLAAEAGRREAALDHYRSAVEADPGHADAQWHEAQLYEGMPGHGREAMRAYRLFAQRFPADPRAVTAMTRAREHAESLRPDTREPASPSARPEPPASPDPRVRPAEDRGPSRPTGVRPFEWRRAERRDPDGARTAFERATRHQAARDFDRAVYFYQRALELDDRMGAALYNLATVHHERGALDEARSAYYAMLERDPRHEAARYNLSMLYYGRGDLERALAHLSYLLQANELYAPAWYLAGVIHSERGGERAEARRHFHRFLALAPDDPAAVSVRRWLQTQP